MINRLLVASLLIMLCAGMVFGADSKTHQVSMTVNALAKLKIYNPTDPVPLVLDGSALTGGDSAITDSDSTVYIQYTSIFSGTRTITAKWSGLTGAPAGTALGLVAGAPGANGAGTKGTPTAGFTAMTSSGQSIVSGIGSCYTGSGNNDGCQLTYTLSITNFGNLVAASSTTETITITLEDS